MERLFLVADAITMKNWYRASQSGQSMPTILEIASATFGFCRKICCWARTDVYRWWKSWIAQKLFSSKISRKGNTMLQVTGFATVSQIANHC